MIPINFKLIETNNVMIKIERRVVSCLCFLVLTTACVNTSLRDENLSDSDSVPLVFTGDIKTLTHTRMAGNAFEENDKVGLFALAGSSTMTEERYVDNLCFVRNSSGLFETTNPIYYPDDDTHLHLISYYPYDEEGVAMGKSAIPVGVNVDQSLPTNYSLSDFLVASQDVEAAPKEPITLNYDHKFFKLRVAITRNEGENIDELLQDDPKLTICGFYNKAMYDFQTDTYFGYTNESQIRPAGHWKIEGQRLVGKDVILVPQETTLNYQYIVLEIGGKSYISSLPSSLQLQSGKQQELEILFVPSEDVLISKLKGEINDWSDGGTGQSGTEVFHNYVDVSKLDFGYTNVYKVLSGGKQVAEICKEYLETPDLSSQAIVAYPMKENLSVDLSHGVVVELLGHQEKIHGGIASWNEENDSLVYTPGNQAAKTKIYFLSNGEISLTMPDEMLSVMPLGDILRDVRGGTIHNYPIVKIGTQYWMSSNLAASSYIDGSSIPKLEIMNDGATGYLLSQNGDGYYYYSFETIARNILLPAGWGIPVWNDWNLLKKYLNNDASLLKSGSWSAITSGTGSIVGAATNQTGFNAAPIGMYVGQYQSDYVGKYVSYWTLNDTETNAAEKNFLLRSDKNEIDVGATGVDKAYAIRCIRK